MYCSDLAPLTRTKQNADRSKSVDAHLIAGAAFGVVDADAWLVMLLSLKHVVLVCGEVLVDNIED